MKSTAEIKMSFSEINDLIVLIKSHTTSRSYTRESVLPQLERARAEMLGRTPVIGR